jgi:hypothetical protein
LVSNTLFIPGRKLLLPVVKVKVKTKNADRQEQRAFGAGMIFVKGDRGG